MKYTRKNVRKVYKKKPTTIKKAVRRVKKANMYKAVKKVVSRMAETKTASYSVSSFVLTSNLASDFVSTIKILNPSNISGSLYNIQQGTGQGARVGNEISTVKCTISGVIRINTTFNATYNNNMCPLYVAMFVVRSKPQQQDTANQINTIIQNAFFNAGNTSAGFTGTLVDLTRMLNTDIITVLKRRVFKVGVNTVQSATAVGTANTANQSFSDGQVSIATMFKMDLTNTLYKKYTYNDTDNTPQNRQTYVFWVPLRVDGQLITTSLGAYTGTIPAYIDFNVNYFYKDI